MTTTDGFHSQTLDFFRTKDIDVTGQLGVQLEAMLAGAAVRPVQTVLQRLRNVLSSPSSTTADVVQAVESDIYVSYRLLTSGSGRLSRVYDAIRAHTRREVWQIACEPPSVPMFQPNDLVATCLWHESAAIGALSHLIALELENCDAEEARTCGLFHGLGGFVLYPAFPTRYSGLFTESLVRRVPREEHERNSFAADHGDVGAAVAQRLDLNPRISAVLRYHHTPAQIADSSADLRVVAEIVGLAERLVLRHLMPDGSFSPRVSFDGVDAGSLPVQAEVLRHLWPDFLREHDETSIMLLPIAS